MIVTIGQGATLVIERLALPLQNSLDECNTEYQPVLQNVAVGTLAACKVGRPSRSSGDVAVFRSPSQQIGKRRSENTSPCITRPNQFLGDC